MCRLNRAALSVVFLSQDSTNFGKVLTLAVLVRRYTADEYGETKVSYTFVATR